MAREQIVMDAQHYAHELARRSKQSVFVYEAPGVHTTITYVRTASERVPLHSTLLLTVHPNGKEEYADNR